MQATGASYSELLNLPIQTSLRLLNAFLELETAENTKFFSMVSTAVWGDTAQRKELLKGL